jgi:hypothetical protein
MGASITGIRLGDDETLNRAIMPTMAAMTMTEKIAF